MTQKLMPNMQAPNLSLPLVWGGTWSLAEQTPKTFTMVIFYRGLHCPLCKVYLTKLNGLIDMATQSGVSVLAASMDSEEKAAEAKKKWGLDKLQLAYGATQVDSKNWGLYLSTSIKEAESAKFTEPGLFWVRPDGRLYLIDISNMPWSRPDLEFMLSKVQFAMDNNYPARGTTVF
jgi:peroxiredoxin